LWITSGETGAPVTGATVFLSGSGVSGAVERTYVTDASGRISLDVVLLQAPAPAVDVTATGFLKRETTLTLDGGSVFLLWPTTSPTGLDEDFTALAVYSFSRCPVRRDPGHMIRHSVGTEQVTLVLDPTASAPSIVAAHESAAVALNSANQGRPTYVVGPEPAAGGVALRVGIDPTRAACVLGVAAAFVSIQSNGGTGWITGGEVVYCADVYARSPRYILHELGHTMGLQHSEGGHYGDLMACQGTAVDFSEPEKLAMKLMRLRPARNNWPDRDRPLFSSEPGALSTGPQTTTIVCPLSGG
jgi:hypothetical protein